MVGLKRSLPRVEVRLSCLTRPRNTASRSSGASGSSTDARRLRARGEGALLLSADGVHPSAARPRDAAPRPAESQSLRPAAGGASRLLSASPHGPRAWAWARARDSRAAARSAACSAARSAAMRSTRRSCATLLAVVGDIQEAPPGAPSRLPLVRSRPRRDRSRPGAAAAAALSGAPRSPVRPLPPSATASASKLPSSKPRAEGRGGVSGRESASQRLARDEGGAGMSAGAAPTEGARR
mmetsp:Transcript_16608/g.62884  ORF Transcript_16608/g.62884 Transcript_16608/m.62884 type:complete len:239 (+) Transcript_16608:487-1203(+)